MQERIQFVDENDNPIGAGTREEAWMNRIHHRMVRVILKNQKGEIMIQKRSANKKSYPNLWTDSATGHVDEGESYEQAVAREMAEEIGINTELRPVGKFLTLENKAGNDVPIFNMSFEGIIPKDAQINLQVEEVSETRWISLPDLKILMKDEPDIFTPGFLESIKRFY